MVISLKGKRALIAGSTQGIGKAAAFELASLGAQVTLLARNEGKLQEVLMELQETYPEDHDFLVADFSEPPTLQKVIEGLDILSNPIHVLINNTGGPPGGKAIEATIEAYQSAFEMHLICNHILLRGLVEGMKSEGYGRIINVISTSVKQPLPNLGVSNTIRGAVANWSKTLANELGGYGITVNNVLPGATATGRLDAIAENKAKKEGKTVDEVLAQMGKAVPAGRVGQPQEVANAIAFLSSPAASYINGINLPVDGGRTASL